MDRRFRAAAPVVVLALATAACTHGPTPKPSPSQTTPGASFTTPAGPLGRPNILVLLADDQTFHQFDRQLMPNVFGQLVDQGVDFTRAYVNTSDCCPSRASILTGLFSHDTGVDSNDKPLDGTTPIRPTFPQALHDAGYRTMLDGKYLNSEPCSPPQPGWDEWVCTADKTTTEVDPTITVGGTTSVARGYTPDILADRAIDFIKANADPVHPFFVYYTPRDPHLPANDTRASNLSVPPYDPPSYDQDPNPGSKPAWTRLPPLPGHTIRQYQADYTRMTQQLPPLDADIGRILKALGDRATNTLVVYLSDNGFLYGEHRMTQHGQPYEESSRVPLVIRWPALLDPQHHFRTSALAGNVDIAPTLMEAAGIPWSADGISLLPILRREASSVRTGYLTEWCESGTGICRNYQVGVPAPYFAIETERYVYVRYNDGEQELYDLQTDPYEMRNLAGDPSEAVLLAQLAAQLAEVRAPAKPPATTIALGPSGSVPAGDERFVFFSQSRTTMFRCRLRGPGQSAGWTACPSGEVSYQALRAGSYTFEAQAKDSGGTLDPTPASRMFTVSA